MVGIILAVVASSDKARFVRGVGGGYERGVHHELIS
jgi:hypothetical protein